MSSFFRGELVFIKRKEYIGLDSKGNPVFSETTISVPDVLVSFTNTSTKNTVEERAVETEVSLYFTLGTVLSVEDVYVIRGTDWAQNGIPEDYSSIVFASSPSFLVNQRIHVSVTQHRGNVGQEAV